MPSPTQASNARCGDSAGAGKTADRRTRLSWRQNRGICCATEEYHPGRIRDREKKEAMEFGSRAQHPRPSRGLGHIAVVIAVVTKYADTIVADLGRRGIGSQCRRRGFQLCGERILLL